MGSILPVLFFTSLPSSLLKSSRLKLCIESLLLHLSSLHFMSSDPAISWAGFVAKAVTHNFSEIQRVFVTRGLGEIRISEPPEAAPAAPEAAGES